MPLISVIVPVYNVESVLACCIENICRQAFQDLEILLIDDGSSDNSGAICDEYALKDKRIVVIHKENGGVSSARNLGIDMAKGEYITFVDSDDWLDLDFLQRGFSECIVGNLDIYCSGFTRVMLDGEQQDSIVAQSIVGYTDLLSQEELVDLIRSNYIASCLAKIIRRTAIADTRFDEAMNWGEDLKFIFALLRKHLKIHAVSKVDYYYRVGHNSATASVNLNKCKSMSKTYKILYGEFKARKYKTGLYQKFIDWRCFSDLLYSEQLILRSDKTVNEKYKMLATLFEISMLTSNMKDMKLIRHLCIYGKCPVMLLLRDYWSLMKKAFIKKGTYK